MEKLSKIPNSEKRKPKNPIRFKIELNEEQKIAKSLIYDNPVVLIKGQAGSGKTLVACQVAMDMFFKREIEKIIITRPNVPCGRSLGFFPGSLEEKFAPWAFPITDAILDRLGPAVYDVAVKNGDIEVVPFEVMRGRSWKRSFILLDEAQNTTIAEIKMFLTRIGFGARAVVTGDVSQIDLPRGQLSGLIDAERVLKRVSGIAVTRFTSADVVRHPLVARIVDAFDLLRTRNPA